MSAYEQGRADERERIVWYLRAGVDGPAAVTMSEDYLSAVRDLADVIERHPERFAQVPVARPLAEVKPCPECAQGKCTNCTQMVLVDHDLTDNYEPCPCKMAGHERE